MASDVDIANLALNRIGCNTISSFGEGTRESTVLNAIYNINRVSVLRDFAWSFAMLELQLALLTEVRSKWTYVYAYPSDCINALYIYNSASNEDRNAIPYEIGVSVTKDKKVLMTNQQNAVLVYTADISNSTLFDTSFVDAFAWKLASELVQPLRSETQLFQVMLNIYKTKIAEAARNSMNEYERMPAIGGTFTDVR